MPQPSPTNQTKPNLDSKQETNAKRQPQKRKKKKRRKKKKKRGKRDCSSGKQQVAKPGLSVRQRDLAGQDGGSGQVRFE
jgi:hypothetical protein